MKKVAYGKLDPVRGTSKFGGGERWCKTSSIVVVLGSVVSVLGPGLISVYN